MGDVGLLVGQLHQQGVPGVDRAAAGPHAGAPAAEEAPAAVSFHPLLVQVQDEVEFVPGCTASRRRASAGSSNTSSMAARRRGGRIRPGSAPARRARRPPSGGAGSAAGCASSAAS